MTYIVGNGLYINLTNKCGNDCVFCIRLNHETVGDSESLWLKEEPLKEDIWLAIKSRNILSFDEIVFCGFGEPTERLEDLLWIAKTIKQHYPDMRIRLNTNGQASLIAGRDVSGEFKGLVDCVSISLNYATAEEYLENCKPVYGIKAFDELLDFAQKVQKSGVETVLSVVDGTTDVQKARLLTQKLSLPLRVRIFE